MPFIRVAAWSLVLLAVGACSIDRGGPLLVEDDDEEESLPPRRPFRYLHDAGPPPGPAREDASSAHVPWPSTPVNGDAGAQPPTVPAGFEPREVYCARMEACALLTIPVETCVQSHVELAPAIEDSIVRGTVTLRAERIASCAASIAAMPCAELGASLIPPYVTCRVHEGRVPNHGPCLHDAECAPPPPGYGGPGLTHWSACHPTLLQCIYGRLIAPTGP